MVQKKKKEIGGYNFYKSQGYKPSCCGSKTPLEPMKLAKSAVGLAVGAAALGVAVGAFKKVTN
ncbi:MAG: hypothetical protein GY861_23070 [bacterium]|nr:hypothetical protein [bacterium]